MNKLLTFFTTFINKMIAHENELEEICKSNLKEKKKMKYEQTPYFFYDLHSRARGVLRPIK